MLSIVLLTTLATSTPGQTAPPQSTPTPAFNVMILSLFVVDDVALARELNLTSEQLKLWQAHRNQWLESYAKLTFSERTTKRAEFNAANDKALSQILDDKQRSALRRRLLWESCRRFGEYRTLNYPELIKELDLTNTQQGQLATGTSAADVLTDAQQVKWRALLGPRPAGALKVVVPNRAAGAATDADPKLLMLVVLPVVQDELRLTNPQKQTIRGLAEQWVKEAPQLVYGPPDQLRTAVGRVEKNVLTALDATQRKRLGQLLNQTAIPHHLGAFWISAFDNAVLLHELKLTREQKHKLDNLNAHYLPAMMQASNKAETIDEILLASNKLCDKHQEQLLKILEPEQTQILTDRYGVICARRLPVVDRTTLIPIEQLDTRPPLLVFLSELFHPTLSKELKLSKETLAELDRIDRRIKEQPPSTAVLAVREARKQKQYEQALGEMKKALGTVTYTRAEQILLQMLDYGVEGFHAIRPNLLTMWPEMIRTLQLSAEQLDPLHEVASVRAVLTREQYTQYLKLCGAPFIATAALTPLQSSTTFTPPEESNFLNQASVQKELQLSAEQQRQIDAWIPLCRERYHQSLRWRTPDKIEQAQQELERSLKSILTATQGTRLRQIIRQHQRRESGLLTLWSTGPLAKEVPLSADEQTKMLTLHRERQRIRAAISTKIRLSTILDLEKEMSLLPDLHEADDMRVEKLLAAATREKLQQSLGEPFTGTLKPLSSFAWVFDLAEIQLLEFGPPN